MSRKNLGPETRLSMPHPLRVGVAHKGRKKEASQLSFDERLIERLI